MSAEAYISALLEECRASTESFCRLMMPEVFTRKFSPVLGRQIIDAIDDDTARRTLILAPRGLGKTSIVQAACARRSLFGMSRFIVNVAASADLAIQQSENIKDMLTGNDHIKAVFGDYSTKEWAMERWTMKNAVHFMPRGASQKVHGMLHKSKRPDFIVLDDMEDRDRMKSDEYRDEVSTWFWESLYGCLDHSRQDWRLVMIATISHEDCLPARIIKSEAGRAERGEKPMWKIVRLSLCDDAFNSVDEEYMSTEQVRETAKMFREEGRIDSFYRQFMNIPMAHENREFHEKFFKYYDSDADVPKHVENFIIMDPAKTATAHSADTAIVCIGFDTKSGLYYHRETKRGKMHSDEIHYNTVDMALRHDARVIGAEVTGLNEHLTVPLQNEINLRAGGKLQIIELHARGKKEDRIAKSLGPIYRQGNMLHKRGACDVLESQLLMFPYSDLWDVMDATSYISEIVALGDRFFEIREIEEEIEREYKAIPTWDDDAAFGSAIDEKWVEVA